ncbi:MAG: SDR family NAD(P)-dependent oxidoreductase, partial [Pseudomonadota bacterium]
MSKTALVTGAGGGIGQALMELLEAHGYRVIAHARTEQKASAAAGGRGHVYADLTDPAEIAGLEDQVG